MIRGILSLMNVTEREQKPVLLMLGYGFFMGIFLAILKIVATTLFLNDPELIKHIREALFISGLLGVASMMVYSYLLNKVKFSTLLTMLVVSIFIFLGLARYLYVSPEYNFQVKYILFIAIGPITSSMILAYYGVFYRLFDFGQSKRIISRIDTGQLIAVIMATYAIPLLMGVISDITDFLIISEIGLLITLIFIIVIISWNKLNVSTDSKAKGKESKFKNLLKDPYVISLALFIFFSMLASTFLDYSFWNVTEQQYPDEKQLASFLGVFEGTVMVISLLLQTFVNDFLIRNFSLKVSILLLPFILLIFTGAALFSGYYFGYTLPNEYFIWFFLFITLSNLFTKILRDATESPILKLFILPLYKQIHLDTQAKIEGILVETTRAIGGGLILLFGLIPSFKLIHYSWIMIVIVVLWIHIALRTHRRYKKKIEEVLESEDGKEGYAQGKWNALYERIKNAIAGKLVDAKIFALKVLARLDANEFLMQTRVVKSSPDPEDQFAWHVIESDLPYLLDANEKEEELPLILKDAGISLEEGKEQFMEMISLCKNSPNPADRIFLARRIADSGEEEGVNILFELVNDQNATVVKTALIAAGKMRRKEYIVFLLENLQKETYRDAASEAIVFYGFDILPELDKLFYNSDDNPGLQLKIIQIYGKIGFHLADNQEQLQALRGYLMGKISYPNNNIIAETLRMLGNLDMKIDEGKLAFVIKELDEEIENLFWNQMISGILRESDPEIYNEILEAVNEDIQSGYDQLFLLLSMIFSSLSVKKIRENIESGSSENISYAMELIDVLFEEHQLSNELKEKVISVFEKYSDSGDARGMYRAFYHGETPDKTEIIHQLINRELNHTNRWTKACALYFIGKEKVQGEYDLELVSNLHNPDDLLSEVAAWSMHRINSELLLNNLSRLEEPRRKYFRALIIDGAEYRESGMLLFHMKYDMVKFFKSQTLFGFMPQAHLAGLVDEVREEFLDKYSNDLGKILNREGLCFIYEGEIWLRSEQAPYKQVFQRGDMLKERNCIEFKEKTEEVEISEATVILSVPKDKFYNFIVSDEEYISESLEVIERENSVEKSGVLTDVDG